MATTGIDLDHRDLDVRPQDDLFRAVSGQWLATAPIPDDRASDGAFHQLRDRAEKDVHALLQSLADAAHEPASEARKVGDLFASFLDRDRVNSLALSPLDADLAAVDAVPDTTELMRLIGALGRQGVPGPVGLAVFADADHSPLMR